MAPFGPAPGSLRPPAAQQDAPLALGLPPDQLQDVVCCLLLAETVYKAAEGPAAAAVAALNALRRQFPPGLAPLAAAQICRASAEQRCMVARAPGALYLAFMGTKLPGDFLADANVLSRLMWAEAEGGDPAAAAPPPLAAHGGFLGRARAVQLEAELMFAAARRRGLRLVLCGHSLGGAVAQLCTLHLLRLLRDAPPPPGALRCVTFGGPAVGNAALADHVRRQGWDPHLLSIALPEDVVPRLFLPAQGAAAGAAGEPDPAEAAGEGTAAAAAQQQQQHVPPDDGSPAADAAHSTDSASPRALQAALATAALAQRPLWAAAGAAAGAARRARAGAGRLLPTFAHVGERHLLLAHGLQRPPGGGAGAAPAGTAALLGGGAGGGLPPAQARQLRQLLLGLHSMQHYRARAAAACWAAVRRHGGEGGAAEEAPVELADDLAPPMAVAHAVARLPVLPPPPAAPAQRHQPRAQQQPVSWLSVAVRGGALEGCRRALLRLPGQPPVQLAAGQVLNLARQRLQLDLAAGAVVPVSTRQQAQQAQQAPRHPDLVLRFALPGAALAWLQAAQRRCHERCPPGVASPQPTLTLLSDFGEAAAPVQLQPQVVWVLALERPLGGAVFEQLRDAAAAEATAEQRHPPRRRTTLRGLTANSGGWAARLGQASGAGGQQGGEHAGAGVPARPAACGEQQPAQPAARRLAQLWRRLAAHARLPGGGGPPPELPSVLLRGQLLLDVGPALLAGGPDDGGAEAAAAQLELAADAVRWAAGRRQRLGTAGAAADLEAWSDGGEEAGEEEEGVPEDEDAAELRQLGLAARLRRRVAQAGGAARRRAALLRRRRGALAALPPPDLLVVLLDHRQLLGSRYGEGLDAGAMAAARRLAAACRACGAAPLLLAVASRQPLSGPYRQQVARGCGLGVGGSAGVRGGVVPLVWRAAPRRGGTGGGWAGSAAAGGAAPPDAALLQAALYAFGASRQQRLDGMSSPRSRL